MKRATMLSLAELREFLRVDDEITQDTAPAHALAKASVIEALERREIDPMTFDADRDIAEAGAELWVYANGYFTDVVGQTSGGSAHGKQGLHPERLARWREIAEEVPVRIVFVEHGAQMWEEVWLGRGGESGLTVVRIQHEDKTRKRQGWWKGKKGLEKVFGEHRGRITFPAEAPPKDVPEDHGRLDV